MKVPPRHLLHDELRSLTDAQLKRRTGWFSRLFVKRDDRIQWYGDIGMYCTEPLYKQWVTMHPVPKTDIVTGPK